MMSSVGAPVRIQNSHDQATQFLRKSEEYKGTVVDQPSMILFIASNSEKYQLSNRRNIEIGVREQEVKSVTWRQQPLLLYFHSKVFTELCKVQIRTNFWYRFSIVIQNLLSFWKLVIQSQSLLNVEICLMSDFSTLYHFSYCISIYKIFN